MVLLKNLNTIAGYLKKRRNKWSVEEQAQFLKRTGELLSRGYPLAEAIESITFQMPMMKKKDITQCLSELKEGYPFYKILFDLDFHSTLIGFVNFAEKHGDLATAFQDGSEMMLKRVRDMQKLKNIFIYPIFLIFITAFLFVFVEKILLPRFSILFQSMKIKENFFTTIIYAFGQSFPLFVFLLIACLFAILSYYFLKFQHYSKMYQKKIITSIPIIGSFFKLLYTHYFSVQLSYLLAGGLSINEALTIFEEEEQRFEHEMGLEIKQLLTAGQKLEDILLQFTFFERELSGIVKHGLQNGKLDQELHFFGKYCLQQFEEKTNKLLKKIQPFLFSIIGLLIVSMYLAILLPMFHLLDGI
ncbi:competence type IV pilus assembly protein ComGB [Cytobacillus sp. Hz8]|uniref:competence type IV pilus assembly protein ComGB n=1 Tax=Cytobacillus sp. Hz8 TaxID=3347168 RepID=UPI0035E06CA5